MVGWAANNSQQLPLSIHGRGVKMCVKWIVKWAGDFKMQKKAAMRCMLSLQRFGEEATSTINCMFELKG
jgi:hypothetical protein